jgi:hypothetical protein
MIARSAIVIIAAALSASGAADAACTIGQTTTAANQQRKPQTPADCVVNFNAVPEISKKIVGEEQKGQPLPKPTYAEPATEPYSGPMIGGAGSSVGALIRRAPEIGYKWSID